MLVLIDFDGATNDGGRRGHEDTCDRVRQVDFGAVVSGDSGG